MIIAVTMRIIVRIIITNITVMCINKRLNDIVFHCILYLQTSGLLFVKPTVAKNVFVTFN